MILYFSSFKSNCYSKNLISVSNFYDLYLNMVLLFRQSKKKKTSESKALEELSLDNINNSSEAKLEDKVEGTTEELEIKVDDKLKKELDDSEQDTNPLKNEKEITADESLADVESLPESQPEQPTKSSKSSKRSTDRKSKSRSSRASK